MVGQGVVPRERLRTESDLAAAGPILMGVQRLTLAAEALGVSGKKVLLIVPQASAGRLTET